MYRAVCESSQRRELNTGISNKQQYPCGRSYEVARRCGETQCICSGELQRPSWNIQLFDRKGKFTLIL